jgi:hypothetical protein
MYLQILYGTFFVFHNHSHNVKLSGCVCKISGSENYAQK